jgi:hypothetical protein
MQRAVNTIDETVFSMWFAYIQCGAKDVFSMDLPRDEKASLECETVKYCQEFHGARTAKMTALANTRSNCKRQTHLLVREKAPHQQTRNCLTVIKIWS